MPARPAWRPAPIRDERLFVRVGILVPARAILECADRGDDCMHLLLRETSACLVLLCSLAFTVSGQTQSREPPAVRGIIPTGLGESIDRDVARLRAATERFKAAQAALAAGYAATATCVAHPSHGA